MSTGSSTPSLAGAGAASAPNANDVALAKPTDSSMTAVSAQLLLVGPDAWPFDDDRQAQLITALKGDLMWSTGRFPDPLKYVVTDVRSSSAGSAPPGRKLLQVRDRAVLKAARLLRVPLCLSLDCVLGPAQAAVPVSSMVSGLAVFACSAPASPRACVAQAGLRGACGAPRR